MLTIGTWLWGSKYSGDYVSKLREGLRRHLKEPHRFEVFHPDPRDDELMRVPGCFPRLRMFDPEWQAKHEIDERVVCLDLDLVITGPLDPLFYRADNFLILTGANAANPCPYNGSIWMLRAGYRPDVWTDFSLEAAAKVDHYEFPDDQAWLAHKLPGANGWKVGSQSGIYAFKKPQWPKGDDLPSDARMVVFPGWRDPSKFAHLPWIKEHWRV